MLKLGSVLMGKRLCPQCNKNRDESKFTPNGKLCATCRKVNSRRSARTGHLMRTYRITLEEYEELAKDGCNVCGGERNYNLPVDHDHALERTHGSRASVRGVLCKRENRLLRDCRDDPELLRKLADYIENPPARRVLGGV